LANPPPAYQKDLASLLRKPSSPMRSPVAWFKLTHRHIGLAAPDTVGGAAF